ncbi:MAG: hypothetical protein OXI63_16190, partial [Candidatus Poribacteria bacterium]|nr:hypothetical protein [Candidatus Poribacteria bacterium]
RPQGLTIQGHAPSLFMGADPADPTISLRDSNFLPIEEALVDSFYYVVDDDNAPFEDEGDDEGKCREDDADESTTEDGPVLGGCSLDGEITEEGGNFDWPLGTEISSEVGDVMVYFWTGEEGDFDLNESEHQSYAITVSKAAAALKVEASHNNTDNLAKYGETATVTIQLVDGADPANNYAAIADAKPVAESGVEVKVNVVKNDNDGNMENSTSIHETDEDGKIVLPFTLKDPDPDADNTGTVIVTVSYVENGDSQTLGGVERTPLAVPDTKSIMWSDAEAKATTIKLSSTRDYVKLPDEGKSARVTISSRVYDQYGDPIKQAVTLLSTAGGKHSDKLLSLFHVTYMVKTIAAEAGAAQSFGAWFISGPGDDTDDVVDDDIVKAGLSSEAINRGTATDANIDANADDGVTVYWAVKASDDNDGEIDFLDKDENVIIVSATADSAYYAVYDSDDQFTITGDGGGAVRMDKFEEDLSVGDTISWALNDDGVSSFTLTNA